MSHYDTPVMPPLTYADFAFSASFLRCLLRSVADCDRSYGGEAFRTCVHGVLLTNDLLPAGVRGGVPEIDGAFAYGLERYCHVNPSSQRQ